MRQIIHVQVGRCGNQVGSSFWQTISEEHNIDEMGKKVGCYEGVQENLNVFYDEDRNGSYSGRAILVDLEPGIIDSVLASKYSRLYKWENTICGRTTASNNYAKGYYSEGSQYIDYVTDAIRREAQRCESLEAFQIRHSLGGGTGSGMGALIMDKIFDEFADKVVETYTVVPSRKVSDTVVQPYNTILSFPTLIHNVTQSTIFDNEALLNLSTPTSTPSTPRTPTYNSLNTIISSTISGLTCGTRFSGQLTTSLRKIAVNMVQFPEQHFLVAGCAPFMVDSSVRERNRRRNGTLEIRSRIFVGDWRFCSIFVGAGRHITASLIFRGDISTYQVQKHLFDIRNISTSYFVQWIPNNIQSSICKIPHKKLPQSLSPSPTSSSPSFPTTCTYLVNTTSINQIFEREIQYFELMFKKKVFVHWYVQEGMEEMEFREALAEMKELVSSYRRNQAEVQEGPVNFMGG